MKIVEIEIELRDNGGKFYLNRGLFMTEAKFNSMLVCEILEEIDSFIKNSCRGYELSSWDYRVIEVIE